MMDNDIPINFNELMNLTRKRVHKNEDHESDSDDSDD